MQAIAEKYILGDYMDIVIGKMIMKGEISMNNKAIVYHSEHHLNTKKLLDAIIEKYPVDLISVPESKNADLSKYDIIGFASGIYAARPHKSVTDFINTHKNQLAGKRTFIICTSGTKNPKYVQRLQKQLEENGLTVLGSFHCYGYDTFGPFKLIGGIRKGHPTSDDLISAVKFFEGNVLTNNRQKVYK